MSDNEHMLTTQLELARKERDEARSSLATLTRIWTEDRVTIGELLKERDAARAEVERLRTSLTAAEVLLKDAVPKLKCWGNQAMFEGRDLSAHDTHALVKRIESALTPQPPTGKEASDASTPAGNTTAPKSAWSSKPSTFAGLDTSTPTSKCGGCPRAAT